LERWLIAELDRIDKSDLFKPVLFEFSFGTSYLGKSKFQTEYVEIDGLKIQGKVDRIELMKDGEQSSFMIGDYKNRIKGVASNTDVKKCISFQMPLYILAVKNILKTFYNLDAEPMGGIYYGFVPEIIKSNAVSHKFVLVGQKNPRIPESLYKTTTQVLSPAEKMDDILMYSLERAKQIVADISNGIFPVEPMDNECRRCGYSAICRIKEKKGIKDELEEISDFED